MLCNASCAENESGRIKESFDTLRNGVIDLMMYSLLNRATAVRWLV